MHFKHDLKYYSTKEVAKLWNMKASTISTYCRKGLLFKAFKDKKTNHWKIPANSIKPLNKKEVKQILMYIIKIHNYLINFKDEVEKELENLPNITPALDYLENFGYISFSNNHKDIRNVLITEKGYNEMDGGVVINIEVSSLMNLFTAILKFIVVLNE